VAVKRVMFQALGHGQQAEERRQQVCPHVSETGLLLTACML
jgi:hypothetical protein